MSSREEEEDVQSASEKSASSFVECDEFFLPFLFRVKEVCQRTKQKFFLDPLLLFLVSSKREQKKDRRAQNFTLSKKGQNSIFLVVPKRERILPNKTSKKRRESKQKNTKDLHHLKSRTRALSFSTLRSEYYCSYASLIIYSSKRDERERESIYNARY